MSGELIIEYTYGPASGRDRFSCHAIIYRTELGGRLPDDGESWVIQLESGMLHSLRGGRWLLDVWRSPAGRCYVADADGVVSVNPDLEPRAAPWQATELGGMLEGVWGLDDRFVIAWGHDRDLPTAFVFDGRTWKPLPEPPGLIVEVHGVARDLVYAVGADGMIAHWDGRRWRPCPAPDVGDLTGVWVESADEMYAVGAGGQVLVGSTRGWSELATFYDELSGVAKWNGELWLAAPGEGLARLEDGEVIVVKDNIKAHTIDAREALLLAAAEKIASTSDGKAYNGSRRDNLERHFAVVDPCWVEPGTPWVAAGIP